MKVTTLQYNANQPMPQQIAVPTNSEYAIGLKIMKDGEQLELSGAELSVDGQTCITTNAGYNVFKLSSDNTEGIKVFDIVVNKGGSSGVGVSYTKSVEGYETFINNEIQEQFWTFGANELSTSDGSTLPETLTLDARKITGSFVATGTDGYLLSGTFPQEIEEGMGFPMVISYEGVRYVVFNNNGEYTWMSISDETGDTTIVGPTITISTKQEDYAEIDGCYIYYPDGIPTKQINISANANISFGTDGGEGGGSSETIKFPLYVQQKDMGYIEVESIGGDASDDSDDDIIIT